MRLDRRVHVAHQIRISRSSPTGVPEELREPGPVIDLDQDFRQLHPWQAFGNDATTLEANAALRSIVRRDSEQGYEEFLMELAKASGIETPRREDLARLDRKRTGKG